jgi:hypothetical protein
VKGVLRDPGADDSELLAELVSYLAKDLDSGEELLER